MKTDELIICEASELAGQLTALIELLFERGTGSGLPVNDPVVGPAYNMAAKVHFFLAGRGNPSG
ncbi:hypothetical protein O3W44_02430 [Pantoea sp. LMR881]|uniref:hypothetical protein n=1 Tax=Pantoea sp. LMR881 TaxID=3014336 RepID=UPI0022AF2579|nr:hypothetical protein [Pantoea sp. LMR881]MCZ4058195.1 hypothetical protein [Pantoea sp. LMR881]